MTDRRIYCVIMRGGTSKAVFLHDNDLPQDEKEREQIILRAFGSPDPRQIDGLGGANSSTSKVAVISVSKRADADIDYDFGQVSVDSAYVGRKMNCGNISAAAGPFAIDEGLVKAVEPYTTVRIFNVNTQKRIIAKVPVKNGKTLYTGDYAISGVPKTASRIDLEFIDPIGAVSGKALPTGQARDEITLADGRKFTVSLVDAANPVVFVRAEELGLKGTELPGEYESLPHHQEISATIEQIRCWAAYKLQFVDDPQKATFACPELPKIAFCTGSIGYTDATGRAIKADDYDVTARLFSMGKMIQAYMVTGTVCTMAAANCRGSLIHELVSPRLGDAVSSLRIGHPFGIIDVGARLENGEIESVTVGRTARRLMEGWVYVD